MIYFRSSLVRCNFILGLSLFISCSGPSPGTRSPEDVTRQVADKIIRETSFQYRPASTGLNSDLLQMRMKSLQTEREKTARYAYRILSSSEDHDGILGVALKGKVSIFLNGSPVFEGECDTVSFREYTYNRFEFGTYVPVHWQKGDNKILVKVWGREQAEVLLMAVDAGEARDPAIKPVPAAQGVQGETWLWCGPWYAGDQENEKLIFAPETEIRAWYKIGKRIIKWQTLETPVIAELVIPGNASYQRDAYSEWHYANGGTMLGILNLFDLTGDSIYLKFVKSYISNVLANQDVFRSQYFYDRALRGSFHRLFRMTMLDDSGGPGIPFAALRMLGEESGELISITEHVLDYVINVQQRLDDGTFSRPEPEASTVWGDDLFMSVPFLLRMAFVNEDMELFDEAARQVFLFNKYLRNETTGLYYHGWYDQRKEFAGVQWGRANGWLIWACSETLMYLPKDHKDYETVLSVFRDHIRSLASYQAASGLWHQVLDDPSTFEETSCTAMFTLAMARGVRMGWLPGEYRPIALKAWSALEEKIGADGTVTDICRGTGIGEDVSFYAKRQRFDHDPRGLGAVLTAGCEISLLTKNF